MPRNPRGLNITNKPPMEEEKIDEIFSSYTSSTTSSWSFDDIEVETNNKNNYNSSAKSTSSKK